MATLEYVEIPSTATRLESSERYSEDIRPAPKVVINLPQPEKAVGMYLTSSTTHGHIHSPTGTKNPSPSPFNFQQIFLSSALPVSIPANAPSSPRSAGKGVARLLTTRDPLSIPITTVNFRRFVTKVGPYFWLMDRIEEIILWKKGWEYTTVWMAVYAFFCYFPRLVLLLPLVTLLSVIMSTDPYLKHPTISSTTENASEISAPPPPPPQIGEGTVDWLANLQAIQNLLGAFSDANDVVIPYLPHVTHTSPYTPILFTLLLTLTLFLIPIITLLPPRLTALILGLTPFFLTHPFTQRTLVPAGILWLRPRVKKMRTVLRRLVDDDRLEDRHWTTEIREVELWENERWAPPPGSASAPTPTSPSDARDNAGGAVRDGKENGISVDEAGWSKANLRPGERRGWTRGRDGWSAVAEDGSGDVSSNLTFSLSPGWRFVETEDWRPDLEGTWIPAVGADDAGWVYTNDTWMEPHAYPLDGWKVSAKMTRRRRWMRRIYFDPGALTSMS